MATITRKELNRLQESERILSSAIDANNDLLRTNSDLKRELAVEREHVDAAITEIINLWCDNLALQNAIQVVHIVNTDVSNEKEPEQITPPPCLKPLDAMKWNEQIVTGSITYRG